MQREAQEEECDCAKEDTGGGMGKGTLLRT